MSASFFYQASTESQRLDETSTKSQVSYDVTTQTAPNSKGNLGVVDIVVVALYILLTLAVGIWASRRGSKDSIKGYFLAGRHIVWIPVGASLFASNIGTGHFIGLAGTGAASGIAIGAFEWIAPFNILQLGWFFLPIYLACKVFTMPEYLHKRFGGMRLRVTLSVISLALYVLTKIAVDLFAGALFIQQAFNINLYLAIVTLLVVTAIYTVLGGLKAVIYTDAMQAVVMLVGGILLMILGFVRVGGYDNLKVLYMEAKPQTTKDILLAGNETTCGIPREDAFHLFRDPITSDLPWPGMLFGIYFLGSWYWCTDQVIVQRTLAAKSLHHAKAGCIMAGFLKIIPMYMIVMTGMISRVLFPNEVACTDQQKCERICGNSQGCSNIAYPKLVLEILPSGLRGIMVAAMLSALMSSLTSIFNSASTIFTIDIWKCIRKRATEKEMLIVGKLTVCVLVVISILWIPVLLSSAGGQLFIYLQSIQSALGPPIFVLYLFAVSWPRVNEQGAFWGLISGFTVGVIRLILDFTYEAPGCDEEETRPWIVHRVNYLHVSPIVFLISSFMTLLVSYLTKPLPEKQLANATWFTRKENCPMQEDDNLSALSVRQSSKDEEKMGSSTFVKVASDEKVDVVDVKLKKDVLLTAPDNVEEVNSSADDGNIAVKRETNSTRIPWEYAVDVFAILLTMIVTFLFGYYA
ncbi:sodium/mannose cotransporter SLC5A10-like [Clavelina lepadiformis]|uniref:sodium/mannose cotransporter SLC5A10-like n=1 Tax=Clavelina lepadiformis TaxID=159417 RepID=UPI0040410767